MGGVIHRPILVLGDRVLSQSKVYKRQSVLYDYQLAGIPLLSAASKDFPFTRTTSQFRKDQFDNSANPGEQSLSNWWLRSQSSYHFGTGINFMEPASDDEVMNAFHDSAGVNPWHPGQLTLLKQTTLKKSGSGTILVMGAVDGSADVYFHADGATLSRETSAGTGAVTWGGSGNIVSLANDGENYYAADSVSIWKGTLAGGAGSAAWNTGDSNVVLAWAKQRLVAGIGPSVYELVGGTPPTLPTALYTHPSPGWKWTAIAEGPTAIYLAGYSGATSAIYKFSLSTTGAMPTLTAGVIAANLPNGETVQSLVSYLGGFIAIGTNKGVRIGTIDTNGDITYGPLVITSTAPVYGLAGHDRFIYATCTDQIDGSSGLWRIDLGTQKQDGTFPYATDLQAHVSGTVQSVDVFGASGRLVFGVNGSGSYIEHATDLEAQGYIQTGLIRFNTVEPKQFKFVSTRTSDQSGELVIETVDSTGNSISVITVGADSALSGDVDLVRPSSEESLALRFTLNRNDADATIGTVLNTWQIKALPAIRRSRDIKVPILLFQEMKDSKGSKLPPTSVPDVLASLEQVENNADTVTFTILNQTPPRTEAVTLESVDYRQMSPIANAHGEGGIVILTLRTVQ